MDTEDRVVHDIVYCTDKLLKNMRPNTLAKQNRES